MKRINLTIDDEIYFEAVKNGMIERQELSKTVNQFLKLYLLNFENYDKTIRELQEEITKLKLKQLNQITKETKKILEEEKANKEKWAKIKQTGETIKRSGLLEDI